MFKPFKILILYFILNFSLLIGLEVIINDVNTVKIIAAILLSIIFIPILILKYKKLKINEVKNDKKNLFFLFIICMSILFNILFFYFNKIFNTNLYNDISFNVGLISNFVLGPIIEELMFRGIIYNNLSYNRRKNMIIVTTVFALMHFNIFQIIYAFLIGLFLIIIYDKYHDIKFCILIHITSNIMSYIITRFLLKDILILNISLFIMFAIFIYILFKNICYNLDGE